MLSPLASIALISLVVVLVLGAYAQRQLSQAEPPSDLVIATGSPGGTFYPMGLMLKDILRSTREFERITVLETSGGVENLRLMAPPPDVDLAFVSSNIAPLGSARLVSDMYKQVLQILVRKELADQVQGIFDLEGLRVGVGLEGSAGNALAMGILGHFHIEPSEFAFLSPMGTAEALLTGDIDVGFFLTAISSDLIVDLTDADAVRFVGIDNGDEAGGDKAHALELILPGVEHAVIPSGTYGRLPREPIHSVTVDAMLVARNSLPAPVVRIITKALFDNQLPASELSGAALLIARSLRENYEPITAPVPYHEGAVAYYRREEPPFLVSNADAISLVITGLAALFSALIALREFVRQRFKNRVDAYLIEVDRLSTDIKRLNLAELLSRKAALERLRRDAFTDLVQENVLADSAFIILQNHLSDELDALQARIDKNIRKTRRNLSDQIQRSRN